MAPRRDVRFVSSGVKLPGAAPAPLPTHFSSALPFAHVGRAIEAAARRFGASLPRVPAARAETTAAPLLPLLRRHWMDGIPLVFEGEPNQEFHGLVCEGANMLPTKFLEDAFRDRHGKIINIRHLNRLIKSINGWYQERGLTGLVSYADTLSGGILRLQVSEVVVNNINIRFLDGRTGEPTVGKTQPEAILRQLTTKKGQAYNRAQEKRDVETIRNMGIMEDVTIIRQPVGDSNKVDLIMNLVERPSGDFSAGGRISSGITNGPLSGLIGSFAYSWNNVFGRNKKLDLSPERGQIDSLFRLNYTDPWTSRTIMVQNSRTPGTLIHGGDHPDHGALTIGRVTAGLEYSRPFRPKWSSTLGLLFQHTGARDDKGNPTLSSEISTTTN